MLPVVELKVLGVAVLDVVLVLVGVLEVPAAPMKEPRMWFRNIILAADELPNELNAVHQLGVDQRNTS